MGRNCMNTLTFGLLAILLNQSLSGYDLMLKINTFWNIPHSRIYPTLAKLEQENYVSYIMIEQKGKPDKKVYSITEKGIIAVKEWILMPLDSSVKKDEFHLRVYCTHLLDKERAIKLIKEREENILKKIEVRKKRIEEIKTQCDNKIESTSSSYFSRYILISKLISEDEIEVKWCRWVMGLYNNEWGVNFLDMSFLEF
jgi:DNA-binding PadR family transcriptional regulator